MAGTEEALANMRANEAGATGDEEIHAGDATRGGGGLSRGLTAARRGTGQEVPFRRADYGMCVRNRWCPLGAVRAVIFPRLW
jgi:hypothetical protein